MQESTKIVLDFGGLFNGAETNEREVEEESFSGTSFSDDGEESDRDGSN